MEEDKEMSDISILIVELKENMSDKKIKEIIEESNNDMEMLNLKSLIRIGWPTEKKLIPDNVKQYFTHKETLFENDGLIWKNNRIILPKKFRKEMIKKLHYNHMGKEKTKLRARESIYWPNMNKEIEDIIENCDTCIKFQNSNQKEELINSEIPNGPWQIVGTDIFFFENNNYLMVIDYFSKYIEMAILPNMSSGFTINILKSIFARQGIPYVVSDGGPQYNCKQFKDFAESYNFKHIKSSPHYPKSNGMAERHIQTVKRLLKKASYDKKDPYLALLEYRNTPISNEIESPNKIMYGRELRGILPHITSTDNTEIYKKLVERQDKNKKYYDNSARNLEEFEKGDRIRVQNKNKEWESAVVTEKNTNPRQYRIMKENGTIVDRNRSHLRRDSNNRSFEIVPNNVYENLGEESNTPRIENNGNDDNDRNRTRNEQLTNEESNEKSLNGNIESNDGQIEQNIKTRPKRNVGKPLYLKDYYTY